MKKVDVSVIIPAYNDAESIGDCIKALLVQTYENFEIIISDDASTDNTKEIVKEISDPRIRYITNKTNMGPSIARNNAIKAAMGKYIFFTDGDVRVSKNWIEEGMKIFKKINCVGVEGLIYYVSEKYEPVYSDRIVRNLFGKLYMTANMAYRKDILLKVGMFNPFFRKYQDRELAFRVLRCGEIIFSKKMNVHHMRERYNLKTYFGEAHKMKYTVYLLKNNVVIPELKSRLLYPEKTAAILFPPLILFTFFMNKYKSREDFYLAIFLYPRIILEKIIFWRFCIKEKLFYI